MMKTISKLTAVSLCAAIAAAPITALADDLVQEARDTIARFRKTDPQLARFFDEAAGYAVFPTVGKGGAGVGGAYGKGVVFEKGVIGERPVGTTTLTQVTVGLQLGGQAYSEIIFFESPKAFADFKKGTFALAAQASAVAAASGASANAKYQQGVAVFSMAKGGLMGEVSVGGQKFSYHNRRA